MNIKEVLKQWKAYTGNNKVTLSGELLIKNIDPTQLIAVNFESKSIIDECVKNLNDNLPFFKIEKVESIAEITIKIFAYNAYTNEENFLEKLRLILITVADTILDNGMFAIELSVVGTYQNTKEICNFRYLNKKNYVEYKITRKESLGMLDSIITRKVKVYFEIVIIMAILMYFIYDLIILSNSLKLGNVLDILPLDNTL